jgi:hypothetical protein
VVEQLGLHCTDLKKIHLSKLKKLNYINISSTGISCKSYQLLLSELQNVVNITALSPFHDALGNTSTENLSRIKYFKGGTSINSLIKNCPNVMVLTLLYIPEDISKLTVLTSLNSLSIKRGIYDR